MKRTLVAVLVFLGGLLGSRSGARAQDVGLSIPATSEASDNKPGSVLIYNLFSPNAATPSLENTQISITNTNSSTTQAVMFIFVRGATGLSVPTAFCLGANKTATFDASLALPGERGFAIAIAVDISTGCPIGTAGNVLTGQARVKLASGFSGTLPAMGVSALYAGTIAGCSGASTSAALNFDGVSYNLLPFLSAVDNVGSLADGKRSLLVLNRINGNLGATATPLGKVTGTFYDDTERKTSYVIPTSGSQFVGELVKGQPVIVPPLPRFVPAGRTGWTRFRPFGSFAPATGAAFFTAPSGATNLRASTLISGTVTIPVFQNPCL